MIATSMVPDPFDTDKQFERSHHLDIPGAQASDLLEEPYGIRSQMWFLKSEHTRQRLGWFEQGRRITWLRERVAAIEGELSRRRGDGARGKVKPRPQGVKL